jgi:hypothetical protein
LDDSCAKIVTLALQRFWIREWLPNATVGKS